MEKYKGRKMAELKKLTSLSEMTPEEFMYFTSKTPKKDDEPGFFGKTVLLGRVAVNKVTDKINSAGSAIAEEMVFQRIQDKRKAAIRKQIDIAGLKIMKDSGEISLAEYNEAMEQFEDEE